jgi:hypothetical protein
VQPACHVGRTGIGVWAYRGAGAAKRSVEMSESTGSARLLGALLIGAGLAAGGLAIGEGLERFRMAERTVTVKGLAEKDVQADFAVWTLAFRRGGNDFASVQQALSNDRDRVVAFLRSAGFTDAEVEPRPLQVEDLFARDYAQGNQPLRFNGVGRVVVKSARVQEVEAAARSVDPLIKAGVQLSSNSDGGTGPRFQLRGFNDVKAPLLADATRNAREQAEKFAAQAGAQLGALKSANQGVIRIADDDGSDIDSGSTRVKRLRVVSTFEYALR